MAVTYEPEFEQALAPFMAAIAQAPKPRPGNLQDTQTTVSGAYSLLAAQQPDSPSVSHEIHHVASKDGFKVPIWHFFKNKDADVKSSAVYYIHGGGYITGSVEVLRRVIEARVESTGVPFFAVDYRLAPEAQYPIPHDDCYTGLTWLYDNASQFNVDASRIAVFGESAGGGLAASMALRARDEKLSPPLAQQMLIYPMLDDRNITPTPTTEHLFTWSHNMNETAWKALLGNKKGEADGYAVPARASNLSGLPKTYIDVGSLDIFVHENIEYAQRLMREDIAVELHVWPNVPHAFEGMAPRTRYGKMALDSRDNVVRGL